MHPIKTPELIQLLTPALNAARDATEAMKTARDTAHLADRNHAFMVRSAYESLRDETLKKLKITDINDLFRSVDAAIDFGDINAIDILRHTWKVAEHPAAIKLRHADDKVRALEAQLTQARIRRGELTSYALNAGLSQYQLAQATDRNTSTISAWKQTYLRSPLNKEKH